MKKLLNFISKAPFVRCVLTATLIVLTTFPSLAQPGQHRPGVYLNYDAAATKYHNIFVDSNNKLYFDGTGGTPSIQFSDYAGTGNRLLYVDAVGNIVRSSVDPAATSIPGGSTTQLQYNLAGVFAGLANAATGNALISAGTGTLPTWGKIGLTTHVSGTLPVANGGTGQTTFTAGRVLFGNGTSGINTNSELFWDNSNTYLGIGIAPASQLHIFENNGVTGVSNGTTIEQGGSGDASLQWLLSGGIRYVMGIDNSDSDKFKLATGTSLGATNIFTATSGSSFSVVDPLSAPTLDTGHGANELYPMNQSMLSSASPTFAGLTLSTTPLAVSSGGTGQNSFTAGRVLFGNGTSGINTNSELFWDNSNTYLGIGIAPASQLHIFENNTTTGPSNGITIQQSGTGDATTQYLLTSGIRYVMGIDNSDSDKFKLSVGTSLGTTDLASFTSGSNVSFADPIYGPTLNTGQGDNDLYAMNQPVRTTDDVDFDEVTATGGIDHGATGIFVKHLPLNIGTWDMTTATGSLLRNVAHGLGANYINIRQVSVVIFTDDSTIAQDFVNDNGGQVLWDSTNITLQATGSGIFDTTAYNSTANNRGYIYITYTTACTHTVCP